MSVWQHVHSACIKAEYLGSLCTILGSCPQCRVLKPCFVSAKISLDIVRRPGLSLCMGLFFLSMGQAEWCLLVHINFLFVDFKAFLSLRFIFTSIRDKKMMIIDAFSLTNPAFIILVGSESLFRGNKKRQFWSGVYTALQCSRLAVKA